MLTMYKILPRLICVVTFTICFSCAFSKPQIRIPPSYDVNLDSPPAERWVRVATDFKQPLQASVKYILRNIPSIVRPLVEKVATKFDDFIKQPYADEIRGLAKAADMKVGDIVMANLFYDFVTYCTSIIARDNKGQIWHARNFDYGNGQAGGFTDLLKNTTIRVNFQRNGKTSYTGVTQVGLIGLVTGQKPNAFTVTVDARRKGELIRNMLVGLLDLLQHRFSPMALVVREALDTTQSYREAVLLLANRPTMAPVYYIVAGTKPMEGVVITKGRLMYEDEWALNAPPGRWFLVETNWDHWKKSGDDRRDTAISLVKQMGQTITTSSLFKIIDTPPVLNPETIYQIVMSAAVPEILTVKMADCHSVNCTSASHDSNYSNTLKFVPYFMLR